MKLKSLFERQELTQDQIDWLNRVVRGTWEYDSGEINVIGNVIVLYKSTSIPVQFGYVTGDFDCTNITSLECAPKEVGGSFFCNNTNITSLQYAPREVGGGFYCSGTKITSLEHAPREVGGDFFCHHTNITSLQYAPREVGGSFYCYDTRIKGKPDISHIQIGGELIWE